MCSLDTLFKLLYEYCSPKGRSKGVHSNITEMNLPRWGILRRLTVPLLWHYDAELGLFLVQLWPCLFFITVTMVVPGARKWLGLGIPSNGGPAETIVLKACQQINDGLVLAVVYTHHKKQNIKRPSHYLTTWLLHTSTGFWYIQNVSPSLGFISNLFKFEIQIGSIPKRGEWLDVWESGMKVALFSSTLKMASSSTMACSGSFVLLLTESGTQTRKEK